MKWAVKFLPFLFCGSKLWGVSILYMELTNGQQLKQKWGRSIHDTANRLTTGSVPYSHIVQRRIPILCQSSDSLKNYLGKMQSESLRQNCLGKCETIFLSMFSKYSCCSISKGIKYAEAIAVFLASLRSLKYIFCNEVRTSRNMAPYFADW